MNIYDTANKLAHELKTSNEYIEYKKAREELNENIELKTKVDEFEKARYEIQLSSMTGGEQDKQKAEEFQKLYIELVKNPITKKYLDLELKFNVILADINKIIGDSVKDVLK